MDDLISKRTAIVALDNRMSSLENVDMQIAMGFAKGIIHALPSVTSELKWIPVSKRLPESNGYYLVTEKDGRICIYVFRKEGNSEEYWKRYVVAWMPLPAPYEPQESEDKE